MTPLHTRTRRFVDPSRHAETWRDQQGNDGSAPHGIVRAIGLGVLIWAAILSVLLLSGCGDGGEHSTDQPGCRDARGVVGPCNVYR